jgi:hypothetical protein
MIQNMKNKLVITIVALLISYITNAQCDSSKLCYYKRDTIAYCRNMFETNKANYIGYQLEKLLTALEIKAVRYHWVLKPFNLDSCKGINLYFLPYQTYNLRTKKSLMLLVTFQNNFVENSLVLQNKKDRGFWLYSTRQFFYPMIVKDFEFVEVQHR